MRWYARAHSRHPVTCVLISPFTRLLSQVQEAPGATGLLGILTGVLQLIVGDVVFGIGLLLVLSAIVDSVYGRIAARVFDEYDELKAELGLHSKVMGLALVLLIRGTEAWIGRLEPPFDVDVTLNTGGFLAAAVGIALLVQDLKSIQAKRARFGQGPIPLLGAVLNVIDRIGLAFGAPNPRRPLRRDTRKEDL